jgi:hypothetical protein
VRARCLRDRQEFRDAVIVVETIAARHGPVVLFGHSYVRRLVLAIRALARLDSERPNISGLSRTTDILPDNLPTSDDAYDPSGRESLESPGWENLVRIASAPAKGRRVTLWRFPA